MSFTNNCLDGRHFEISLRLHLLGLERWYIFKQMRNIAGTELCMSSVYTSLYQLRIKIWDAAEKSHLICLEKAQKPVLMVMCNKPFRYPIYQLYSWIRVLSVRKLYIMRAVVQVLIRQFLFKKSVFKIPQQSVKTIFPSLDFSFYVFLYL